MSETRRAPPATVRLDTHHSVAVFVLLQTVSLVVFGGWLSLLAYPLTLALVSAVHRFTPFRLGRGARLVPPPPAKGGGHAVLITGCSSGIGRAAAAELARAGYVVLATVRKAGQTRGLGEAGQVVELVMDVTDAAAVEAAERRAAAELERRGAALVGVVNNAGYSDSGPVETVPMDAVRRQFEVNVFGQLTVSRAFLPLLRRGAAATGRTSRLVFVGSVVGHFTIAGLAPYCASKHALRSFADGLRMELAAWPVDVVQVEPGAIESSFGDTYERLVEANAARGRSVGDEADGVYRRAREAQAEARAKRKSGGVHHTSEAILDSIGDEHPLTTYRAGNDARFQVPVMMALPDRWRDKMLGKAFVQEL